MVIVTCPGFVIEITPPHWQRQVQTLVRAGFLPTVTVAEPGVQGEVVAGIQGAGVNAPNFAAVAAATTGFESVIHIPNGMMFFMGTKSIIVAAGSLLPATKFSGVTVNVLGATPKLHISIAPDTTCCGIFASPRHALFRLYVPNSN